MNITFYKTKSETNKINKTLSDALPITGSIKDNTNIVSPTIKVQYNANLLTYNYCYIPVFNRYYFVNSVEIDGDILIISLSCDVLMSFKNDILSSKVRVIRSSSSKIKYLPDSLITQTTKTNYIFKKLGTGFNVAENTNNYVLVLSGKE
jgi:hypothetical protein